MSNEVENTGKILIYQNEKGDTKIDVYFEEDTIWMTQRSMAELYQVTPQNITTHIKHIYEDGELEQRATCKSYLQVQMEGNRQIRRDTKFYNLDMILAVGYRVRSNVGIHFRRWASGVLTEYMKKGFALNDERLRNPREFGADYFDELLERIRDIRASEKRLYQKVKEIFALSIDYDSKSQVAQNFFKSVQNKLEYAATGHTAPELIAERADASKDNMGLTSFKGIKVRRGDVTVAKNYMTHEEISTLNLIVNMYLDYAELQAKGHNPRLFPKGTILFAMYASIGECSIAETECCSSQAILGIEPDSKLNNEFLYYLLSNSKGYFKSFGQASSQPNLNKGIVQSIVVQIPEIEEQAAIAEVLSTVDREIELLQQDIEQEKRKKKALMQLLLTGIVRVKT